MSIMGGMRRLQAGQHSVQCGIGSAPVEGRTLTGLALLLQSNALRTVLATYNRSAAM
jgi:hypothetical protein